MKKLILTTILVLLLTPILSQIIKQDTFPTKFDCYRFPIDTIKHYSKIYHESFYDSSNFTKYYKISQSYSIKEWKKYYGYTKVWWIDFTVHKWKNDWLMGNYWKYTEKFKYYEIIYNDTINKQQSINILKQQLEK